MNWQSQIIELLTASLIRPIVLAAAAWLILRIYKVRHPASRHAVWTAVLIGTTVLPLVTVIAPQWKLPLLPKEPEPVAQTQLQLSNDSTETESSDVRLNAVVSASQQAVKFAWPRPQTLIVWCYFAGILAMVIFRLMGWALLWRVMSKSRLLRARLHESSEIVTPVTVGVFRPAVILPAGWRAWSANTKRAVLAHEFAHIRRRDTLTSSLCRLAKCIYWFHPLVWWISRQMSELAELSCDAAALEKNGDPGSYSRILLGFAETVHAAGYRAALPGLAMASGSGMSHRIDQVFELAGGNLRKLSRPGTVLALMGLPVICIAAVVGLTAPATQVLNHATAAISPPQPLEVAQSQVPTISPSRAPQPTSATPPPASRQTFDSASIKPCSPNDAPANGGRGGRGGAGARYFNSSPGRLSVTCMTVSDLIDIYVGPFGENDRPINSGGPSDTRPIRNGPSWIYSDRYTIEAATADPIANGPTGGQQTPASRMLQGPLLEALLEDRFHLKTHRETEEAPMYALTVAKGGFKLKPIEDGACTRYIAGMPNASTAPDGKPWCDRGRGGVNGPNWVEDDTGVTLSEFATGLLHTHLDRPIIDRTGIAGLFSFHLEYARDESAPGPLLPAGVPAPVFPPSDVPPGPTIFTALEQQLGLKLEPIKGPRGFLVIDHIERPSEN